MFPDNHTDLSANTKRSTECDNAIGYWSLLKKLENCINAFTATKIMLIFMKTMLKEDT